MAQKYLHHYDRSIQDLTKAIELDPQNVEYLYNRSQCYLDIENYKDASTDLTNAIEIDANGILLKWLA